MGNRQAYAECWSSNDNKQQTLVLEAWFWELDQMVSAVDDSSQVMQDVEGKNGVQEERGTTRGDEVTKITGWMVELLDQTKDLRSSQP